MAFLLFALVAAVTPGPSNVMVMAAGAQGGIVRGLPCLLGVTTGMGLMLFVVPLGLGSLVLGHPSLRAALHWGGAAFLLWLAWKVATSTSGIEAAGGKPVGYAGAAIFQWVNPKSWLVSVSASGTFLGAGTTAPFWHALALGGLFMVAALPSCFLWLAFGAAVQRLLREPRRLRVFNVIMGVLLAASVVLIVR